MFAKIGYTDVWTNDSNPNGKGMLQYLRDQFRTKAPFARFNGPATRADRGLTM